MKLSAFLITTLVLASAAMAFPQRPTGDESRLERLDRFLNLLPEDLRAEIEDSVRDAVANGKRPQISDEVRDQIREHMSGLKQQHQHKLNRFLSMLPEELRREVEAVLEQSAANGEFPKASEELRNKIRDHFAAMKEERKHRLDKFMSLLSEELRAEVEGLLREPLVDGERPRASDELREKIREHFQNLKGAHRERLDRFLSMLPEDLRQEVEVVLKQALVNGERPRAPEELQEKIREHFGELKETHRDQLELVLNYLPKELRDRIELEIKQNRVGHGMLPRFSGELLQEIREYFERLLPAGLKEQILAEVQRAIEADVYPVLSEDLREKIRRFMEMLMTPQLFH
ncbi:AAEL002875-PA [Aedes aegypti]|uniref:AAEL002875-PA n=1 Tax=Aedes aegypti TaxID=7159 RepID=Q17GX6_AEDAE|nr:AAEL002875-PA [Aedes aegypti]